MNQLREIHPDIFAAHSKKYESRPDLKEIRERTLPILDCTMDDLVFFVSVDFSLLLQAFSEIWRPEEKIERFYFRIDTEQLEQDNLMIAFPDDPATDESGKTIPTVHGYLPFADGQSWLPTAVPASQLEAYKRGFQKGTRAPLAAKLPHIYYKGAVNETAMTKESFTWDSKRR